MDRRQTQEESNDKNIEFIYINKEEDAKQIRQKLTDVLLETTYFDVLDNDDIVYEEGKLFENIIETVRVNADVVTIIVESEHIDASYTDTYYNHFAGLHFHPSKYCKRLSFFQGEITPVFFLQKDRQNELKTSFVGTMIIRPLRQGFIGRTLLDPTKIKICDNGSRVYLRGAKFRQHILGMEFEFLAFPFCSQDSCFMTCAEVTIMNMMEYYAMRYHTYRAVLPNDIKKLSQQYQYERVTPSAGLTYLVVSKILSEFGFSPRIYNIEAIKIHPLVGDDRENEIKRIMHYYIESGIPVAVNVEPRRGEIREGHSLLCIGHSDVRDEERAKKYSLSTRQTKHAVINSADFYTQYCVIDDHQKPYAIRDYRELSKFDNMWISNLAVPMYKKMYLEAKYAYDIFYDTFRDEDLGLKYWNIPTDYLKDDEAVVMRIYQASSRNYKEFKINSYDDKHMVRKAAFAQLQLPQFIWCCEFFSYSGYVQEERLAFAEIVLDATASLKNDYTDAIIAIETVDKFIERDNKYSYKDLIVQSLKAEGETMIPIYNRNLDKI